MGVLCMRTYIGPIGFNPTSITRPILSHGLDHGDAVVLIRPENETDDRRAQETMVDLERNLGALEPDVSVSVKRIPHDDFDEAILRCQAIIREASDDAILILGGGARDVLIPLTIAGLANRNCIAMALTFSDVDGAVSEEALPALTASVSESAHETLNTLDVDEQVSLPALAERLDHSKSTITRHVNELDEQGLLETQREGRSKHVRKTVSGELHQS